jgi:hypothetical protein
MKKFIPPGAVGPSVPLLVFDQRHRESAQPSALAHDENLPLARWPDGVALQPLRF